MDIVQHITAYITSPTFPWKRLLISLSMGEFLFEAYLTLRQYRVLCKPRPPSVLAKDISQETFDKSQAYGRAKAKASIGSGLWYTAFSVGLLQYNGLAAVWRWSGNVILKLAPQYVGSVGHSMVFAVAFLLTHMAISVPPNLYQTFVVEGQFGFNKQSLASFASDQIKTALISSAIVAPSAAAFVGIVNSTSSNKLGLYLCGAGIAIRVLVITVYPVFILPLFFKLSPLEDGDQKELAGAVQGVSKRLSFPLTKLYVADGSSRSSHSNALFFGFPWQKNILIFDTLLDHMDTEEVVAVITHELGHWKLGHTTWLTALTQVDLVFMFGLFAVFIKNPALYSSFGFVAEQPVMAGFLLFCQALPPVNAGLRLYTNHFSRRYEFEADGFAKDMGCQAQLSTALVKLHARNLSTVDADPVYSGYHFSHPLLAERLAALS